MGRRAWQIQLRALAEALPLRSADCDRGPSGPRPVGCARMRQRSSPAMNTTPHRPLSPWPPACPLTVPVTGACRPHFVAASAVVSVSSAKGHSASFLVPGMLYWQSGFKAGSFDEKQRAHFSAHACSHLTVTQVPIETDGVIKLSNIHNCRTLCSTRLVHNQDGVFHSDVRVLGTVTSALGALSRCTGGCLPDAEH
jgi:hypothetical protein